jgi:signal transduction histidine kinase
MLIRMETSFNTQNNFISNASHELRTPLTAIIGEADVALTKVRDVEEYIETIKVILEEAENLDKKTQALLFLAQTGFNGKTIKFDKVRMDQLLWDVKVTTEKINPKSKIVIDMSLLPENPMKLKVNGNNQLLHLAVSNIILNACKYSKFETVNVSLGSIDTYILLVVKDSGIGIPESEIEHIYDPFFRASNTQNFEGYGIGLPLTRNIIHMHGGELLVNSIQNIGTTVQIKLPIGQF